jgi:hypothetical protein
VILAQSFRSAYRVYHDVESSIGQALSLVHGTFSWWPFMILPRRSASRASRGRCNLAHVLARAQHPSLGTLMFVGCLASASHARWVSGISHVWWASGICHSVRSVSGVCLCLVRWVSGVCPCVRWVSGVCAPSTLGEWVPTRSTTTRKKWRYSRIRELTHSQSIHQGSGGRAI